MTRGARLSALEGPVLYYLLNSKLWENRCWHGARVHWAMDAKADTFFALGGDA